MAKKSNVPKTDTAELIKDLEIRKGDTVRTYELRDKLIEKLKKLEEMEKLGTGGGI